MLGLTVHDITLPDADAASRRTTRGRWLMMLVLLVCASPVILSYFTYFVLRPDARNNYAMLIQPTVALPAALPLQDASGAPVLPAALKGQWLLVVVAGGACDARCESLLYQQRQLREMMGRDKERVDRVWLVDDAAPLRDPILRAMSPKEGAWVLRVPHDDLAAWLRPEPGQTLADSMFVVDPMGEWMMRTPASPDPMKFKRDLERLLRASAFWDRPGREAH